MFIFLLIYLFRLTIKLPFSALSIAFTDSTDSLKKLDSFSAFERVPDIGYAAHVQAALDDDRDQPKAHDGHLEHIRPHHSLHPALHNTKHTTFWKRDTCLTKYYIKYYTKYNMNLHN